MKKVLLVLTAIFFLNISATAQNNESITYSEELVKQANLSNPEALYKLGLCYLNGYGVEKNYYKGVVYILQASSFGSEKATELAASIKADMDAKSEKEALEWAEKLKQDVDNNDLDATFILASAFLSQNDLESTEYWLTVAADKGHLVSQYSLGGMLISGQLGKKDLVKGAHYMKLAAENGSVPSMTTIAFFYSEGIGVEKDLEESVKWLKRAVDCGDVESMTHLGFNYFYGDGVIKDQNTAVYYWKKAFDLGDGLAAGYLADSYLHGDGVIQNVTKALKYAKTGAVRGDSLSMGVLAEMYENGYGVTKDLEKADMLNTASGAASANDMKYAFDLLYKALPELRNK